MPELSQFIITFLQLLLRILLFAIFARIILSWIDQGGQSRITQILYEITEPILLPIRRIMPNTGMFDLSPMVAIILLQLLSNLIIGAVSR
jgi:YggT family protein